MFNKCNNVFVPLSLIKFNLNSPVQYFFYSCTNSSNETTTTPFFTLPPALPFTDFTNPSRGARNTCSIFMANKIEEKKE